MAAPYTASTDKRHACRGHHQEWEQVRWGCGKTSYYSAVHLNVAHVRRPQRSAGIGNARRVLSGGLIGHVRLTQSHL